MIPKRRLRTPNAQKSRKCLKHKEPIEVRIESDSLHTVIVDMDSISCGYYGQIYIAMMNILR